MSAVRETRQPEVLIICLKDDLSSLKDSKQSSLTVVLQTSLNRGFKDFTNFWNPAYSTIENGKSCRRPTPPPDKHQSAADLARRLLGHHIRFLSSERHKSGGHGHGSSMGGHGSPIPVKGSSIGRHGSPIPVSARVGHGGPNRVNGRRPPDVVVTRHRRCSPGRRPCTSHGSAAACQIFCLIDFLSNR
jgi:hypothetical protein